MRHYPLAVDSENERATRMPSTSTFTLLELGQVSLLPELQLHGATIIV